MSEKPPLKKWCIEPLQDGHFCKKISKTFNLSQFTNQPSMNVNFHNHGHSQGALSVNFKELGLELSVCCCFFLPSILSHRACFEPSSSQSSLRPARFIWHNALISPTLRTLCNFQCRNALEVLLNCLCSLWVDFEVLVLNVKWPATTRLFASFTQKCYASAELWRLDAKDRQRLVAFNIESNYTHFQK